MKNREYFDGDITEFGVVSEGVRGNIHKKLLTFSAAAEYLGISRSFLKTIFLSAEKGYVTAPKCVVVAPGQKGKMFLTEDLDAWRRNLPRSESYFKKAEPGTR